MSNASVSDSATANRLQEVSTGARLTPQEIAEHTEKLVGYHYTVDDYYEVGREKVREYARAVQDAHPTHWNEQVALDAGHKALLAPLTFVSLVGLIAQRRMFEDVVTGYDLSQIMQADQRLVFHKPITVGDRLICDVSLDSFRQMAGNDLMVTKNIIRDQNDELVQTTWTTLVGRSGGDVNPEILDVVEHVMMIEGEKPNPGKTVETENTKRRNEELGDPDPNPKPYGAINFDDLTVGQELEPRVVRLTRGTLANYAGVAGDPNPIHISDEIAKLAGMENPVAHGMCTMGMGGAYITNFVGDPGAVYEYNVRFSSPVYVPAAEYAEIEFTGKIKALDPQTRRGEIALVAKHNGRKIFGRAQAKVQFA